MVTSFFESIDAVRFKLACPDCGYTTLAWDIAEPKTDRKCPECLIHEADDESESLFSETDPRLLAIYYWDSEGERHDVDAAHDAE